MRAERAAEKLLRREGYVIEERNYRSPAGEIDIIAREGATLCFVEVKLRTNPDFGEPIEALTNVQQLRIRRAAALYLARFGERAGRGATREPPPCRFDFVSVTLSDGSRSGKTSWELELIRDAF